MSNSFDPIESTDFLIAKAKYELSQIQNRANSYKSMNPQDARVWAALQLAVEAPLRLEEEYKRINKSIAELERAKTARYDVRIQFLKYSKWLAQQQANRAASTARMRLAHFETLVSDEQKLEERRKCEADTLYWFKYYGWTYDPRGIIYSVPFLPFDFQEPVLQTIDDYIFTLRTDLLIEKSRDEGVTWLVGSIFVKHWLFKPEDKQVHFLCGSQKEDKVDKLGDPSSIFEKLRFQIRMQPSWLLPQGLDAKKHLTFLALINPESKSSIVGESANADFARSGRYTAILKDESASWQHDEAADAAASQSTNCKIDVSTPKGKLNRFYKIRVSGDVHVIALKWDHHPWKSGPEVGMAWYDGQKLKMSPEMVAQELDISYDASQPGRVYPNFDERYHVITWSEFAKVFKTGIANEGTTDEHYRIPPNWYLARGQDWGSTTGHPCVTLWFATAPENSGPLAGSIFIYRQYIAPTGSTPRQVAIAIKELEAKDEEGGRVTESYMSHEAKSERDTYNQEHGLDFTAWDTDPNAGIAMVSDYLEIDFKAYVNPFRPELAGRPRMFIIVEDSQGEFTTDPVSQLSYRRSGHNDAGAKRLREEFSVYHYPTSESGKSLQKHKPDKSKGFDDAMDVVRGIAKHYFAPIAPMTNYERREAKLPAGLKTKNILEKNLSPDELAMAWWAQQQEIQRQELNLRPAGNWRDSVYDKAKGIATGIRPISGV